MSDTILKTHGLTKKYGNFTAVSNMDIEVKRGEIYGLVGKNGAGKTTLLKMVSGLALKNSGSLELFGETTETGLNKARKRTGCMIETPSFLPYLSAEKNLEYYRQQRGIVNPSCIRESLEFVGLADTGKKRFKNFSLGMKQRLGLALAIMGNPEFLILDEPINGLDPMGIVEFREMILKLNRERNTTILISSHILGELSQIATTYGFIHNGKLVEHISAGELEEKCKRSLKLKVSDTAKAAVTLQNELNCNEFLVLNEQEIQIGAFLDTPETIVQALVKNNVMVADVHQTGLNLEEYFIELVGGMNHA
ncbi:MAG: ATP-binding cassette domain-containing protein [Ruminococcaceae bacterium]|nr:ATP-binding cassette domain-containing protein [Oscillospiraceae bacterium]HHV31181.1 ATP-binding cassette domain-containing protein [Clostridiales bacterium]